VSEGVRAPEIGWAHGGVAKKRTTWAHSLWSARAGG
jgi:hypothetical protein